MTAFALPPESSSKVLSCTQATRTAKGVGPHYAGRFENDDYKVHAIIPQGLIGWSGVANSAPFHGFTIYLNEARTACVLFDIYAWVRDEPAPGAPAHSRRLRLGQAPAWQSTTRSRNLVTVATGFSSKLHDRINFGAINLISPLSDLSRTKPIYDKFVNSFSVGK